MIHEVPDNGFVILTATPDGWVVTGDERVTDPDPAVLLTSTPVRTVGLIGPEVVTVAAADPVTVAASGRNLTVTSAHVQFTAYGPIRFVGAAPVADSTEEGESDAPV